MIKTTLGKSELTPIPMRTFVMLFREKLLTLGRSLAIAKWQYVYYMLAAFVC
jgi:hypothetical protein